MLLDVLPNEIQQRIFSYTEHEDINNLRLVNHVLHSNATKADRITLRSNNERSQEQSYNLDDAFIDLEDIAFRNTRSDNLAHLAGLTNLQHLDLTGTHITDAGLAHLANLTNLQHLDLGGQ
jgi:Leucine-rich repeat (LRR) protein